MGKGGREDLGGDEEEKTMIRIYCMKNIFNKKKENKVCMTRCKEEEGGEISKHDKTIIINEAKKENYSIIKCCIITSFRI